MINELYELSRALDGVATQQISWHRQYGPIPKIRKEAPCISIVVDGGKVSGLSVLDAKYDQILRKYGSKHSYPCMNLAPLYRITDEKTQKALAEIEKHPEKIDAACIEQMKAWCTDTNWGKKFQDKYKICMVNKPLELQKAVLRYRPLKTLIEETKFFTDAEKLHSAMAERAWAMLTDRTNTETALKVLFYRVPKSKSEEADYGSISVAFDCEQLIEEGIPAISERFVQGLNQCLRDIDEAVYAVQQADSIDAFGIPFQALEEPMPNVKLAGGFDVTLRTMFRNQYCQTRYGKIGNASYPISPGMRSELKDALEWLGAAEQKDKTWINIDQKEILFAYPVAMPKPTLSYTKMFKRSANQEASFQSLAEEFVQELRQTREAGMDSHAKGIRIFVLKQVKKACTKIVYTCQTDPDELERFSEAWTQGCANLPSFQFGDPATLFPVDVADVLNRFWNRSLKQDGKAVTEKFKPFSRYRGIELLMDPERSTKAEMHRLAENAMNSGPFFGSLSAKGNLTHTAWEKAKDMLALMGLLLDREHVRKEGYMENLPYLYGQLFKATDELHALYCRVVRKGDFPPQFVGSELFPSAAEAPVRTMNVLSQRIMPYYSWAKSYQLKGIEEKGKESWRARWLYRVCEEIMGKIKEKWTAKTRFNDEEKAQMFIGYLAALTNTKPNETKDEEDETNE